MKDFQQLSFKLVGGKIFFRLILLIKQDLVLVDHVSAGIEEDCQETSGRLEFKDGGKGNTGFRLAVLRTNTFAVCPTGHGAGQERCDNPPRATRHNVDPAAYTWWKNV